MKRFFFAAVAATALLVPSITSAQRVKMMYRPELRGYVAVPAAQAPPVTAPAPTPAEVIAIHTAIAQGYRANPNDRGAATAAAIAHCDRLVASARETLRKSF
jgi:hypothetical protein